jgi:hypothetical protein
MIHLVKVCLHNPFDLNSLLLSRVGLNDRPVESVLVTTTKADIFEFKALVRLIPHACRVLFAQSQNIGLLGPATGEPVSPVFCGKKEKEEDAE